MDNGDVLLQEILENEIISAETRAENKSPLPVPNSGIEEDDSKNKKLGETHTQWAIGGNGRFMPVGSTIGKLEAGIYEPFAVPGMWGLERINIESDGLYTLPDMATETVLQEVNTFWNNEARYRKHGLLYKRGIILWGPAGSGKTATVKILMNELVRRDGIVVLVQNATLAIEVLKAVRRVEPKRNLIMVFEDIDEIINYSGESIVLSMLDGENNIDRVLNLATTNHPERLGARIINRPSRFDRRLFVGMPSSAAREAYLRKATHGELAESDLSRWVEDTEKMSIAHLRELVAAVYCLDQPYEDVVDRLRKMADAIKADEEFRRRSVGFAEPKRPSNLGFLGSEVEAAVNT